MAKKNVKSKTKLQTMFEVPSGYKIVSNAGFAPSHDFEKEPTLQGSIVRIDERTFKEGTKNEYTARVATIEKDDGKTVAVWESTALRSLFDSCYEGSGKKRKFVAQDVIIHFEGLLKIKGQAQPMKNFVYAVKE